MEQLFTQIFTETWVIAWLFVSTFLYFIWKWIPAVFKKFEDMSAQHKIEIAENQKNFQEAFDRQRLTFEETMNKIVHTFEEQISKSNDWHKEHSKRLEQIENILKNR